MRTPRPVRYLHNGAQVIEVACQPVHAVHDHGVGVAVVLAENRANMRDRRHPAAIHQSVRGDSTVANANSFLPGDTLIEYQ